MASLRVGGSISPLLTMHGRFRRGELERKRHMPMIQNVSLIEETIQRGVESGGFARKIGEQAYLNEVLSTLDFRGEAVLGRKEFTQRVSVSVEVLPWSVFPVGSLWKGTSSLRLVRFLMSHPLPIDGRAAAERDLGEDGIKGNGTVFGTKGIYGL